MSLGVCTRYPTGPGPQQVHQGHNWFVREADRQVMDARLALGSPTSGRSQIRELDPGQHKLQDGEEVDQRITPVFTRPDPPALVGLNSHSLELQWNTVQQLIPDPSGPPDTPRCELAYSLEMQLVDPPPGSTPTAGPSADGKWSCCYRGTGTSAQVPGLRPGRHWAFRVTCIPTVPQTLRPPPPQQPSSMVCHRTPSTQPNAPQAPVSGRRERYGLVFKWRQPDETGGEPITSYMLQFCHLPGPVTETELLVALKEVYSGPDLRFRVGSLQPGQQYAARLQASNSIGPSLWSLVGTFTTMATVPGQPQPPEQIESQETSVTVAWSAPEYDGGSAVSEYQLECDDGRGGPFSRVYTGPDLQREVPGLKSGRQYQLRVTAFNLEGRSVPSLPGTTQTAASVPDPPEDLMLAGATQTSVTLRWKAPGNNGGADVQAYEAEIQPRTQNAIQAGMDMEWNTVFQDLKQACTVYGLKPGCGYRARVRARNSAGLGPCSRPVDVSTASSVPGVPSAPHAITRLQDGLHLEWAAPDHNGGADITCYRLESARGNAPTAQPGSETFASVPLADEGLSCQAAVKGLDPGSEYLFRVAAINKEGASPFSEPGRASTRPGPPLEPEAVQLVGAPTTSALQLCWQAPASRGTPVTAYHLECCRASALPSLANSSLSASASATDLNSHSAATGEPEARSLASTLAKLDREAHAGVPVPSVRPASELDGSEQASTVSSGEDQNHASASAGNHVGPPSRSGKRGRRGRGNSLEKPPASGWHTVYTGNAHATEVKGLEAFTDYAFRLRAMNAAGASEWSRSVLLRTDAAAPSCPLHVKASGDSSEAIIVSWQEPVRENGAAVTSYTVMYASGGVRARSSPSWHRGPSTAATSAKVDELRPGREYLVRVRASNARGQGPWSDVCSAETTAAPPGMPRPPTFAQRTAHAVKVRWECPEEDNGATVLQYRLHGSVAGAGPRCLYSGIALAHRVTDLPPGSTCTFQVQACNIMGESERSEPASTTLLLLPPPPPSDVTAETEKDPEAEAMPKITVRWTPGEASELHGECATQEVELAREGGQPQRQSCPGRALECTFSAALPAGRGTVRVRCIGADGAGHGEWSLPGQVSLPDHLLPAAPEASISTAVVRASSPAAEQSGSASGHARGRRRTGRGGAAMASIADAATRQGRGRPGAAVARAPPSRRTVLGVPVRLWRRLGRWTIVVLAVSAALAISLVILTALVEKSV